MALIRIRAAADLLGVSDDTVRRWIDAGELTKRDDESGRAAVDGADLAAFAERHFAPPTDPTGGRGSARNRMVGIVTDVVMDTVMAEVSMQCGRFRVVSLMSSESARSLGLEPGVVAVAVVKATTVIVETDTTAIHGQGDRE